MEKKIKESDNKYPENAYIQFEETDKFIKHLSNIEDSWETEIFMSGYLSRSFFEDLGNADEDNHPNSIWKTT